MKIKIFHNVFQELHSRKCIGHRRYLSLSDVKQHFYYVLANGNEGVKNNIKVWNEIATISEDRLPWGRVRKAGMAHKQGFTAGC